MKAEDRVKQIKLGLEYSNEKFSIIWGMFGSKWALVYNEKGKEAVELTNEQAIKIITEHEKK